MVSFIVKMKFAEDDRQQVTEYLRNLSKESRQEPGCLNYMAHFADDDPATVMVLIYECYQDNASLEAHRSSPHFKKYAVAGLYQLMRERTVENLTLVV